MLAQRSGAGALGSSRRCRRDSLPWNLPQQAVVAGKISITCRSELAVSRAGWANYKFRRCSPGRNAVLAGKDFSDFLVWRRDDVPAYQLACVVDDNAMQITEVVRGADLLKSTARQILVYQALSLSAPTWAHCDLMTDDKGVRLAKRHDALSLRALRQSGRRPEEVVASFSLSG